MKARDSKRLPKILRINRVEKDELSVSVLFSTGENRILNFSEIFKKIWKVRKEDPEHKLLQPNEFAKVELANYTLSWSNAHVDLTAPGGTKRAAYEVGADTLYPLSEPDLELDQPIGYLIRKERLAANLSQEEVAELSGTSRTYITRLENGGSDVELMTLKKIVEAGLNKRLTISIQ